MKLEGGGLVGKQFIFAIGLHNTLQELQLCTLAHKSPDARAA